MNISHLRGVNPSTIAIGSHAGIIQSIFDFDYLTGKAAPSIVAIIASGRTTEKYFFGNKEVILPVYTSPEALGETILTIRHFMVLTSARRVLGGIKTLLQSAHNLETGMIFAEGVPELHALEIQKLLDEQGITGLGPSSVGLIIPGYLKLGAIGGVQPDQLFDSRLDQQGSVAVVSSSGGIVNELMRITVESGHGVSFGCAVGGELYPITTPQQVFLAAEHDTATNAILYFGELGGTDEYEITQLIKEGKITKPVFAYVAGVVSDLFETPPQFGHAKAMAASHDQSATAKKEALRAAGVIVADSFSDLKDKLQELIPRKEVAVEAETRSELLKNLTSRRKSLITTSLSYNKDNEVQLLGEDLTDFTTKHSFAYITGSVLLGKKLTSKKTEKFIDTVLRMLVDHGPNVSGTMNTIVSARAGKDMVSSLVSGLLTIGPRFGGAINDAAKGWLKGVLSSDPVTIYVEKVISERTIVPGIGHKKYRQEFPDPRVQNIQVLVSTLKDHPYTDFARQVEIVTLAKKSNLILNIDGMIAAAFLDMLSQEEGYSREDLERLTTVDFFNALFVLSRSVGFMGHYFDQARLGEGLFRLDDDYIWVIDH